MPVLTARVQRWGTDTYTTTLNQNKVEHQPKHVGSIKARWVTIKARPSTLGHAQTRVTREAVPQLFSEEGRLRGGKAGREPPLLCSLCNSDRSSDTVSGTATTMGRLNRNQDRCHTRQPESPSAAAAASNSFNSLSYACWASQYCTQTQFTQSLPQHSCDPRKATT